MSSFKLRPLAVTIILATSATLSTAFAADQPPAPTAAPAAPAAAAPTGQLAPLALDAPPPKPYTIPSKIKEPIRAAVTSPTRVPSWLPGAATHDAYRKPAELLQFANVRKGQRVVEIQAYGNYWSPMLSEIVGEKGELWMYDALFTEPYSKYSQDFVSKHPNSHYQLLDLSKLELPKGVDLVWCVGCLHELMLTGVELSAFHAKLLKAMKPGATYIVVFANSKDGRETNDAGALHRLDPAAVRGIITSHGFELYQEDRMFYDVNDPKTGKVITEAEGDLADRTVYMFRKP